MRALKLAGALAFVLALLPWSTVSAVTSSTQNFGPYASGSTDSGTCGPDWANDTFDRFFAAHRHTDGTFLIVENFKDGDFSSIAGPSPGACPIGLPGNGHTIRAGVTGDLQGFFKIPLPVGTIQTSHSSKCVVGIVAECTTANFINTHFTSCYPDICPVTTFFFHYTASGQGLIQHDWTNASADRGGNKGDMRTS